MTPSADTRVRTMRRALLLLISLVAIGILANIARQEQWPPPGGKKQRRASPAKRPLRVATQTARRPNASR